VKSAQKNLRERSPKELARIAHGVACCERCPLYIEATQAVAGEGPAPAAIMLVGEQPGDQEDRAGRPFVGPAGRLLDRALKESDLDRGNVFVTNVVKHFKHEQRGKRRIHKQPSRYEVRRCRWWLDQEMAIVKPALVVALGATAAREIAGRPIRSLASMAGSFALMMDGTHSRPIIPQPSFVSRKKLRGTTPTRLSSPI
jgi:uracil-DNA glycosylase